MSQTEHYKRVDSLMEQAGQGRPNRPTVPDEATRITRAKFIFEEAIRELLYEGLGVNLRIKGDPESLNGPGAKKDDLIVFETHDRETKLEPNLALIADGCADTIVVTTGTLIACGIEDKELLELVDNNNLAKFGPPICTDCGKEMLEIPEPHTPGYYLCVDKAHSDIVKGGYRNESGKWVKPSNHRPPDIQKELDRQRDEKLAYLKPQTQLPTMGAEYPANMIVVDESDLQVEFPDVGPHARRIYIGAPLPDPNAFLGNALEQHRASEEKRFAKERDPRLGKRVKYTKHYHGNVYTSGRVIGSGDEAPINEPAKHGQKYLVIDDDVCFDTLWILETEVTFVD